jgi:hypothetical protein
VSVGTAISRSATCGAASSTCSKLSKTKSSSRSCKAAARLPRSGRSLTSRTPSACATAGKTSDGSRTAANGTNAAPSAKSGSSSEATAIARRVLPTPPGPVSVISRTSDLRNSLPAAAISRTLPISGVMGVGSGAGRSKTEARTIMHPRTGDAVKLPKSSARARSGTARQIVGSQANSVSCGRNDRICDSLGSPSSLQAHAETAITIVASHNQRLGTCMGTASREGACGKGSRVLSARASNPWGLQALGWHNPLVDDNALRARRRECTHVR